ncbi:MAG: hypothetical protein ACLFQV_04190 [Vulcanimicrobiota bacterium]
MTLPGEGRIKLVVDVVGTSNNQGQVLLSIFQRDKAEGVPSDISKSLKTSKEKIEDNRARFIYYLSPGGMQFPLFMTKTAMTG